MLHANTVKEQIGQLSSLSHHLKKHHFRIYSQARATMKLGLWPSRGPRQIVAFIFMFIFIHTCRETATCTACALFQDSWIFNDLCIPGS